MFCRVRFNDQVLFWFVSSGSEYSLELDLAHPVVPAQSGYRVLSTKIEIKLRKGEGIRYAVYTLVQ